MEKYGENQLDGTKTNEEVMERIGEEIALIHTIIRKRQTKWTDTC